MTYVHYLPCANINFRLFPTNMHLVHRTRRRTRRRPPSLKIRQKRKRRSLSRNLQQQQKAPLPHLLPKRSVAPLSSATLAPRRKRSPRLSPMASKLLTKTRPSPRHRLPSPNLEAYSAAPARLPRRKRSPLLLQSLSPFPKPLRSLKRTAKTPQPNPLQL